MNHLEHENSCSGSDQKSICLVADGQWKDCIKKDMHSMSFLSFLQKRV